MRFRGALLSANAFHVTVERSVSTQVRRIHKADYNWPVNTCWNKTATHSYSHTCVRTEKKPHLNIQWVFLFTLVLAWIFSYFFCAYDAKCSFIVRRSRWTALALPSVFFSSFVWLACVCVERVADKWLLIIQELLMVFRTVIQFWRIQTAKVVLNDIFCICVDQLFISHQTLWQTSYRFSVCQSTLVALQLLVFQLQSSW